MTLELKDATTTTKMKDVRVRAELKTFGTDSRS